MSDERTQERICILGLGHVGLTLGLALADVGFPIYGYDIKESVREAVRSKTSHFKEKGLPELLEKHVGTNFAVVDSLSTDPHATAYFVTVGTPFKFDNTPDYTYIQQAAEMLGGVVKKGDIVILRSTVPMGTTREVVIPIIEKHSSLRAGEDFLVAFAPERTVEGNAFHELKTLPQIIGGLNEGSFMRTKNIFLALTETIVPLDTLEEAEIVKLINNTYRETIFAFANQVSLLSRAWGIDTKKVIEAANQGYPRSQVPFPSPGVGGYCLTKDSYLFIASAKKKDVDTRMIAHVRELTSTMLDVITRDIVSYAKKHALHRPVKIGVLGFAFKGKPETSDVRGSTTFALLKRLNHIGGFAPVGFDPAVLGDVIKSMGATPLTSMEAVIEASDIVVIMNNNPLFSTITPEHFKHRDHRILFFDTWGLCKREAFKGRDDIEYWTL